MPNLEDIEKFKQVLNTLGDEPAILEERGEALEEVPLPEEGLPDDLSELLGEIGEDLGGAEPGGEEPTEETDELDQLGDFEQLPDQPVETEDMLEGFGDEDFLEELPDTLSLEEAIPEEEGEAVPDEFALPEGLFEEGEEAAAPDDDTFEDEFALPEEETGAVPDEFTVPEEPLPEEPVEEPVEEPGGELEDEFGLPEGLFEEGEEEPAVTEDELAAPEEFQPAGEEMMEFDTEEGFGELSGEDFELPDAEEPADEGDGFELPEDLKFTDDEELDSLSEDMLDTEGFTLGDISEEFGDIGDEEPGIEEAPGVAVPELPVGGDEDFSLTDDEFKAIQRTMGTLPRNLKLAIEEAIGEQGLAGKDLQKLLAFLLRGASPRDLATITGKILGRPIKIPAQYEKRTGLEFEEEKGTFAYAFRHNILPIVKVTALAIVVLAALSYVGYQFVYRPIHAQNLYKKGYEEIENQRYGEADDFFRRGFEEWKKKNWFYQYAEAYIEKKEYSRAEEKYEQLLSAYPMDRKGIFDYATLESETVTNYAKAEELYNLLLDEDMYDQEALLAQGDNYMRWGEEDYSKFEEARFTYATLIQRYGHLDILELRMLQYFMRMDMLEEVVRLKNQFQANPRSEIDPVIYARMAGYLVSRNRLDDVQDILFRVMDIDDTLPEAHYYLSQYFRKIEEYSEEEKGINNALVYFQRLNRLSRERLEVKIHALGRKAEILMGREEYLSGEEKLLEAIDLYEDGIDRGVLAATGEFGKLYENLGDIYYYQNNDYTTALQKYEEAEQNGYVTPNLLYKKGFIYFNQEDYQEALMTFYAASEGFSTNKNLLFATANTLYKRNDFFLAEGYYHDLLASLEQERRSIPYLRPDERTDHRGLLEFLIKTYNNLGVTLYRLSERSERKDEKYASGLVNLTKSAELADAYSRDPEGMERSEATNLAWLNTRGMLYPAAEFIPQIYTNIPKDMDDLVF